MKRAMKFGVMALFVFGLLTSPTTKAKADEQKQYVIAEDEEEFIESVRENYSDDEYGGMYYDDDGQLVIQVLEPDTNDSVSIGEMGGELSSLKSSTMKKSSTITTVKQGTVKYSLEYLERSVDILTPHMQELGISSIGTCIRNNNITITAKVVSDDLKNYVYEYVKPDAVEFLELDENITCSLGETDPTPKEVIVSDQMITENEDEELQSDDMSIEISTDNVYDVMKASSSITYLPVGTKIEVGTLNGSSFYSMGEASLGFPAKNSNNGDYGYLTCGHHIEKGYYVCYGNVIIGKITAVNCGGNQDYAFITSTDHKYRVSSQYDFVANANLIVEGKAVGCHGFNGNVLGKITSTHYSYVGDGYYYYDMVKANYVARQGDSGGGVYIINSDIYSSPNATNSGAVGLQSCINVMQAYSTFMDIHNLPSNIMIKFW